jgi:heme/copper-type cytochrome/quinol oxidase subunit 2
MSNRFRAIMAAVAVVVVVVVVVVVKVSGGNSDSTTTTGATQGPTTIEIVVRGGKIQGGLSHPKVKHGSRVVIHVTADVSDEVHLHGYDIMRDVAPGAPATIAFTAKLPGRFEAELESRKQQILDLDVEP